MDYSGYSREELFDGAWLKIVHPDERDENVAKWIEAVTSGTEFLFEHRFKRHDGEYRWQLGRAIPYRDQSGEIQSWIGTSTDIQQQKDFQKILEQLVDERTKELKHANIQLKNSNQELSSFAYISSHDLQEPLRKIQTFISIIKNSDFQNLTTIGKANFEKMRIATTRMKTLINDLLTYSRTSPDDRTFEQVDIGWLLAEIRKDYADVLHSSGGKIEIGSFMTVNAIVFQLRQLFTNLISNSLKFAQSGVPPIIRIDSETIMGKDIDSELAYLEQKYLHIRVSDNGIGFGKEYEEKIFEVFARLHGKSQYEGTGIGLAIVKKIIENHKGIVTAESDMGKGTTFHVYIPRN